MKKIIKSIFILTMSLFLTIGLGTTTTKDESQDVTQNVSAVSNEDFSINPTPQEMKVSGDEFLLTSKVGIIEGKETDEYAVNEVIQALENIGVDVIVRKNIEEELNTEVNIWVGGPAENKASQEILNKMGIEGPDTLDEEGYVLASNKEQKNIVLSGKDKTGTYYAAQTFKQILQNKSDTNSFPQIEIRDWPQMPMRGSIEGFFDEPWSHEDRLNQLEFYGDNKFNTYIYAPKDDPYHRDDWREPYPEEELDEIKELIDTAKENHVNFVFSLSPGLDIRYSGDEDYEYLEEKMEQIWDLGVRSFAIFYDDIDKTFHWEEDEEKFGENEESVGTAHAYLLNRFNKEFIDTHDGAERLITVPTDYSGQGATSYRNGFADLLNEETIVMWTGDSVVAQKITSEDAEDIYNIFKQHDILLWDNYPVNDYDRDRLFISPLENRDADLTEHGIIGLTTNPMNEAEASKIPMYTIADYTWNQNEYNPEKSWERSLKSFGGDATDALKKFAENSYFSPLRLNDTESLVLTPLIKSFWENYATKDSELFEKSSQELYSEFQNIREAIENLQANFNNKNFIKQTEPWLNKLHHYSEAGETAVKMLIAQYNQDSDKSERLRSKLDDILISGGGEEVFFDESKQAIRKLDGVNRYRGGNELILYTPEYGNTTETNQWGYEIIIENDLVVKRGGNNSVIPDNGYVLSAHNPEWLRENSLMITEVQVDDGQVILTIPEGTNYLPNNATMGVGVIPPFFDDAKSIQGISNVSDLKESYEKLNRQGEIFSDKAIEDLQIHLNKALQYEDMGELNKLNKHLKEFKDLIKRQNKNNEISDHAYVILKISARSLIEKEEDTGEAADKVEVKRAIYNLPRASELTLADKDKVEEVREMVNNLSDEDQEFVTSISQLEAREDRITELEDKRDATQVKRRIYNLPRASELTLKDKEVVEEVRVIYDDLSEEAKALVTTISQLEAREDKLTELAN